MVDLEKAKQEARKVIKDNYVTTLPVKIEELVQNYGLKVVEADFGKYVEKYAGFLDHQNRTISVNDKDTEFKKVFSIAHGLGHFLLHNDAVSRLCVLERKPLGQLDASSVEEEANCFAVNVLIPEEFLKKYASSSPDIIAKIFGVTEDVIGYRLK